MYAPLPQKGMETGMKKFRIWILAALAAALCLLCGCSAEDFALPHEVQLAVGQQCALAGELRFTGSLSDITPQDRAEFAQAVTDAVVHIASTDPSVAAVDQDGNVTAVTPGTATVLVSCVDLDFYAEVNINVVEAATPESAALATPETAAQSTPETATPESAEPATPETAATPNHKKEDSRPFLRIGYLLLRMFVLHQKHREWTFRTISPTEAYFPGISPKISMAEKTFDTILFHSAKPLLTASHQSVLAFQFQPAVLGDSIP